MHPIFTLAVRLSRSSNNEEAIARHQDEYVDEHKNEMKVIRCRVVSFQVIPL